MELVPLLYQFNEVVPSDWRYYCTLTPPRSLRSALPGESRILHLHDGVLRVRVAPSVSGTLLPWLPSPFLPTPLYNDYNYPSIYRVENAYRVDLYRWKEPITVPFRRSSGEYPREHLYTYHWIVPNTTTTTGSRTLEVTDGVVELRPYPELYDIAGVVDNTTGEELEYTVVDDATEVADDTYTYQLQVDASSVRVEYRVPVTPILLRDPITPCQNY